MNEKKKEEIFDEMLQLVSIESKSGAFWVSTLFKCNHCIDVTKINSLLYINSSTLTHKNTANEKGGKRNEKKCVFIF